MNALAYSKNDDINENVRTIETDETCRNDEASGKVERLEEETKDLKSKIVELQKKLELHHRKSLKKDDVLKSLSRKRDRLENALRIQEEYNKNLHQQLEDEKTNSTKEKQLRLLRNEYRAKLSTDNHYTKYETTDHNFSSMKECLKEISRLEKDNYLLRASLQEQAEKMYNICVLYMRLKHSKDTVISQLNSLSDEFEEVSNDMIEKLRDARNEINNIADSRCHEPIDRRTARMLRFAQRNGQLVLENSTLRLEISHLKRSLTTLKREQSLIKINTRTFEVKTVPSVMHINAGSDDDDLQFYNQSSVQRDISRENLPKYYTKYSRKHKHNPPPWDPSQQLRNTDKEECSTHKHKVRIPKLHIPQEYQGDPGGDHANGLEIIPHNDNNGTQETITVPNHRKTQQKSKYHIKSNTINVGDSTDTEPMHLQRMMTNFSNNSKKVPLVNTCDYPIRLEPLDEFVTELKADEMYLESTAAESVHPQCEEHETVAIKDVTPEKQISKESVISSEYYINVDVSRIESAPGLIENAQRYITLTEDQ